MKRIFALLLTVVMSTSVFPTVFAENEVAETTETAVETVITPLDTESYKMLRMMGIIENELDGKDKGTLITRAQFIGWLFRLAGYTANTYNTDQIPFQDVSTVTPYCNEICTMYEMGRVNGTDPGMFSPDDHVTYSQACKLIIDVLGYRNYAEIKYGEYPEGYVMMAGELDINDGVKNVTWNSELTAEDAVRMLYNAGSAEVFKFAGTDANGNPKYATDGEDLFATNDIFYGEGVLESDGISTIKGDDATLGITVIGGKQFVSADGDLSSLLGCKVKYYYRDDKTSQKLLWAVIDARFSNTLELYAENLVITSPEYTLTNIVYYEEDGKKENAKINQYADVIYNNSRCGIPSIKDIQPKTGTIRLIDNNDDEVYDVVIVKEYDNLFVTHIYEEKNQIFAKYNKTIDFADYKEVKILKDGKEITINDIENHSIISFIVDKEKTKIYLYPEMNQISGTLKATETKRGRQYYIIGDKKYRLSNAYKSVIEDPKEYAVSPELGKEYNFWLDYKGEIAEVQLKSDELQYALLMSVRKGEEYEECGAYTRLLLTNNAKVTGGINKKVTVNGVKKTDAEFLADARLNDENGDFMCQIVMVSFDEDGYLKKLNFASVTADVVDPDSGESLYPCGYDVTQFSRDYRGTDAAVRNQDGYYLIDNKYLITENTIIFSKWHEMDVAEPYEVVNRSTTSSGPWLKDIYDINDNMQIGVMYREGLYHKGNWQTDPMLVDTIDYVYDNDQEVKRMNGYVGGKYTSYIEEEPGVIPDTIVHGDLVWVSVRNNKLNKTQMLLSNEEILSKEPKALTRPNGSDGWNQLGQAFAPLYRMDYNSITIITPPEWKASVGNMLTAPRGLESLTLTIYDVKNDEIYRGDFFEMYQKFTIQADGTVPIESDTVMAYVRMRYVTAREIILMVY